MAWSRGFIRAELSPDGDLELEARPRPDDTTDDDRVEQLQASILPFPQGGTKVLTSDSRIPLKSPWTHQFPNVPAVYREPSQEVWIVGVARVRGAATGDPDTTHIWQECLPIKHA